MSRRRSRHWRNDGAFAPKAWYRLRRASDASACGCARKASGFPESWTLLILTPDACYPVDFKDTEGGARRNHRVQLTAYALLAEEAFGLPAPQGFIYLVPRKAVVTIDLREADRQEVRDALAGMRRMIAEEALPPPTLVRARCVACEYRNYCGDIW